MSDAAPEVEVTVTPPDAPPVPVDDAPDVVVVDTSDDDGGHEFDAGLAIGELTARVAQLETALGATVVAVEEAEEIAEQAEETADLAVDLAVTPPVEEVTEEAPDDEPPASKPWTHRTFGEIFKGSGE